MAFPQDPSGPPFPGDAGNPSQRPAGNRPANGARITGYGSPDDPTQGAAGGSDNSWLFESGGAAEQPPAQPQPPQHQPQQTQPPQFQPEPQPFQPQQPTQPQYQPQAPEAPQFQQPRSQPHEPAPYSEPAPAPSAPAGPSYSNLPPLPDPSELQRQQETWLMEHDGSLPAPQGADEEGQLAFQGSYAEPEDTTRQAARWAPRLMALVFLGALGAGGFRFYQRTAGLVGDGPVETDESGLAPGRNLRQGVELVGSDRGGPASSPFRNDGPREIQSVRTRYDGATREPGELTVLSGNRERQPSASVDPAGTPERPGPAAQPGPKAPGSVSPDAQANEQAVASADAGPVESEAGALEREAVETLDALDSLAGGDVPVPSDRVPVSSLSPVLAGTWLFLPVLEEPEAEASTVEAPSYLALGTDPLPVVILPTSPAPGQGMRPTVPTEEALRASIAFVGETPRVEVVPVERGESPAPESEGAPEAVADAETGSETEPGTDAGSPSSTDPVADADPASEPLPEPVEVRVEVDSEARPEAPVTDRVALEVVSEPGSDFSLGESPDAWLERRNGATEPAPAGEGDAQPARPTGASPAVAALLAKLESEAGASAGSSADAEAAEDRAPSVGAGADPVAEATPEPRPAVEPEGDATGEAPVAVAAPGPEAETEDPVSETEDPVAVAQEGPRPDAPADPATEDGADAVADVTDDVTDDAADPAPAADVAVAALEPPAPAASEDAGEPRTAERPTPADRQARADRRTPSGSEPATERDALLGTYADWMLRQDVAPLAAPGGLTPFQVAQGSRPSLGSDDPEAVAASAQPEAPKTLGVLQRLSQEESWQGTEPPMQFLRSKQKVATPNVGAVRVMQKDGEMFEGRLLAIGQNKVWVDSDVGTMALMGERVRTVERLDPTQLDETGKGTADPDFRALPHVRVRTAGGVFVGRQLDREGSRITLMTDDGYKITLVSDDVQDADAASSPNLRRLDGKQ